MDQDYIDIKEYCQGSMSAFNRIYLRYERQIFFYIKSMVNNNETAEDIFQSVWIKVVEKLPTFTFKGSFKNWLYTVAHHKVIDFVRKNNKQTMIGLDEKIGENEMTLHDILADPAPDIIAQLSNKELFGKVMQVVENLPHKQREVFLLRVDAGLKFKEIAEFLETSSNTVLGRMHYAVSAIRKKLKKEYKEHENI